MHDRTAGEFRKNARRETLGVWRVEPSDHATPEDPNYNLLHRYRASFRGKSLPQVLDYLVHSLTFAVPIKTPFLTSASDAGTTPLIFQSLPSARPISLPSLVLILTDAPSTDATVPRMWTVSAAEAGTLHQHPSDNTVIRPAAKHRSSFGNL